MFSMVPMAVNIPNPYASRADSLKSKSPELIGDFLLYGSDNGGKLYPAFPGWGCPCVVNQTTPVFGFDGWPLLDEPLHPGDLREKVGFVFLTQEGAETMRNVEKFYLWEGKFVGEVSVLR